MRVKVCASKVNGAIRVPSSKSDAHRAIISASLAQGQTSLIKGVDFNDDILATIEAMKAFGANIEIEGNSVKVKGASLSLKDELYFDAKESGSTLRFLIPLFAHFSKKTIVTGSKRLLERPLDVYLELMKDGILLKNDNLILDYKFKGNNFVISGNISSQFISGLLFLLPLLKEDSIIEILPPFESKSYVLMTISTLKKFGINIKMEDNKIFIHGNQEYKACSYEVEGDFSQAAFFIVLGSLNNDLVIKGLNKDSLQGDKVIIDILRSMGAQIEFSEERVLVKKSKLNGTIIDIADCPDLGPILMVVASFSQGETRLINAGRLRLKESDRVSSMEKELRKFGVDIYSNNDEVIIKGCSNFIISNEIINSHNDHRIAMSLSILMTSLNDGHIILDNAQCINKSYPNFYKDLNSINGKVGEH